MHKRFSFYLCVINIISMLIYLGYFGYWYFIKKYSFFHNEKLLLLEILLGIIITIIPYVIERIGKFYFPEVELILFYIFIYMASLLGSGLRFYYRVIYWDKYEHFISMMLFSALGFSIFSALSKVKDASKHAPLLISMFSFTFGVTIGAFWEIYEFTMDGLFNLNLQRYFLYGKFLFGRPVLYDTMTDIIMDILGSLLMAIIGYTMLKLKPNLIKQLTFTAK